MHKMIIRIKIGTRRQNSIIERVYTGTFDEVCKEDIDYIEWLRKHGKLIQVMSREEFVDGVPSGWNIRTLM